MITQLELGAERTGAAPTLSTVSLHSFLRSPRLDLAALRTVPAGQSSSRAFKAAKVGPFALLRLQAAPPLAPTGTA